MSVHERYYGQQIASTLGLDQIVDPGANGTFDFDGKSYARVELAAAGTYTLPNMPAGTRLMVHGTSGAVVLQDAATNTVATGTACSFDCVARTASTWTATVFSVGAETTTGLAAQDAAVDARIVAASGTVDIALAASVTVDGMDITFTVQDEDAVTVAAVHRLEWWISEDAQGEGLTADTYSGDVTTVTGTELTEVVSKKHYVGLTDVNGVLVALAVDSANPTDQYVAAANPYDGKVIVSAVSGTNWEGA